MSVVTVSSYPSARFRRYEYRTADAFLRDFELMKTNAIKFNGPANHIAQEAVAIHEFVRDQVNSCRAELKSLEDQVDDLMNATPKKKLKTGAGKGPGGHGASSSSAGGVGSGSHLASVGGHTINLGNLGDLRNMAFDDDDSDSDDESIEL
jgi:Bromodomain